MISSTVSVDAEESSRMINDTLSAHRESIDSISGRGGRRRRLPATGVDRQQIQRQATLVRLLSITESFCTERLLTEIESMMSATASDHVAVQKIWDDSHGRAIATWDALHKAYHAWLDVPKKTWTQLLDLTNARNAVAHGHGQLTWKQQRGDLKVLEEKLNNHEITLDGTRLILSEASISHAAALCRTFIIELDAILKGLKLPPMVAVTTT
ncbi:hypothetical protein ACQGAO_30570 [Rhodococcus sp. 1.20]